MSAAELAEALARDESRDYREYGRARCVRWRWEGCYVGPGSASTFHRRGRILGTAQGKRTIVQAWISKRCCVAVILASWLLSPLRSSSLSAI